MNNTKFILVHTTFKAEPTVINANCIVYIEKSTHHIGATTIRLDCIKTPDKESIEVTETPEQIFEMLK